MQLRRVNGRTQRKYEAIVKVRPPLSTEQVRAALALHDSRKTAA